MASITGYSTMDKRGLQCNGEWLYTSSGLPVAHTLPAAYQGLAVDYPRFAKMDALCRLAFLAAEAVVQRLPRGGGYSDYDTGVIFSNRSASLNTDTKYMDTVQAIPSPALFVCTLPNVAAAEVCIRNKFKGEQGFFITPGFDAPFFYRYVTALFAAKRLKRALCGWVEVWQEDYKSFVFMADDSRDGLPFTVDGLQQIYKL